MLGELFLEGGDQLSALLVDRAHPAEKLVMLRDLEHPLARHVLAPQHVLEERHHVVGAFGPAERDDEQGVVGMIGSRRVGHL